MLTDIIIFMLLIFNGMSVAAIFVMRRRFPTRRGRIAYPVIPWSPAGSYPERAS